MSDASPLILLAKADLLETLLDDFPEQVLIPPQVQVECCENKDTFDAQLIARLIKEKRITVRKLKNQTAAAQIRKEFNLGKGEAEAIALARAAKAKLVFIIQAAPPLKDSGNDLIAIKGEVAVGNIRDPSRGGRVM